MTGNVYTSLPRPASLGESYNTAAEISTGYDWHTVFHEYLAGIIFSEFVILEISRVFNLAIPKKSFILLFIGVYTGVHPSRNSEV